MWVSRYAVGVRVAEPEGDIADGCVGGRGGECWGAAWWGAGVEVFEEVRKGGRARSVLFLLWGGFGYSLWFF